MTGRSSLTIPIGAGLAGVVEDTHEGALTVAVGDRAACPVSGWLIPLKSEDQAKPRL